ncbi:MAG: DNA gyrase modulator, partial [Parvibaculum sp.]|nr:DNA gyrase modulator [Parvibaculum sp.]
MTSSSDDLFFTRTGLDRDRVASLVGETLTGADDGELFMEYRQSEVLGFDDGRLKTATFDTNQGFGLRCVAGEATGYAHASELSEAALKRASDAVQAVKTGHTGVSAEGPARTNTHLYSDENPLGAQSFEEKVKLLAEIDAYARAKDPRIQQVSASL